jgi:hypothetical protein
MIWFMLVKHFDVRKVKEICLGKKVPNFLKTPRIQQHERAFELNTAL